MHQALKKCSTDHEADYKYNKQNTHTNKLFKAVSLTNEDNVDVHE